MLARKRIRAVKEGSRCGTDRDERGELQASTFYMERSDARGVVDVCDAVVGARPVRAFPGGTRSGTTLQILAFGLG